MAIEYTVTSPFLVSCDENSLEVIRDSRRPTYSKPVKIGHIYFLFDGDEIVYVGQTTHGESRIYNHRTYQNYKDFDSFTMLECDIKDLDRIEGMWISTLQPKYNRHLGVTTEYYARANPRIKDCFPGRAFSHLVKNYSIRSVQLQGMGNPRYHLEDLHDAAKIAVQLGHLEVASESPVRYEYISKAAAASRRREGKKATIHRAKAEKSKGREVVQQHQPSLVVTESSEPLLLLPTLAEKFGLQGALFLQELQTLIAHQLQDSQNENPYWVKKRKEEWIERHFPFWSLSTIKRTIIDLIEQGVIATTDEYNQHPADKTLWYSINYEKISNGGELDEREDLWSLST